MPPRSGNDPQRIAALDELGALVHAQALRFSPESKIACVNLAKIRMEEGDAPLIWPRSPSAPAPRPRGFTSGTPTGGISPASSAGLNWRPCAFAAMTTPIPVDRLPLYKGAGAFVPVTNPRLGSWPDVSRSPASARARTSAWTLLQSPPSALASARILPISWRRTQ